MRVAAEWRERGYVVEAFLDAPRRPAYRDRVLHSSGYREARVLCAHGRIALTYRDASMQGQGQVEWLLEKGAEAPLRIGAWHTIRNAHNRLPSSWLYVML